MKNLIFVPALFLVLFVHLTMDHTALAQSVINFDRKIDELVASIPTISADDHLRRCEGVTSGETVNLKFFGGPLDIFRLNDDKTLSNITPLGNEYRISVRSSLINQSLLRVFFDHADDTWKKRLNPYVVWTLRSASAGTGAAYTYVTIDGFRSQASNLLSQYCQELNRHQGVGGVGPSARGRDSFNQLAEDINALDRNLQRLKLKLSGDLKTQLQRRDLANQTAETTIDRFLSQLAGIISKETTRNDSQPSLISSLRQVQRIDFDNVGKMSTYIAKATGDINRLIANLDTFVQGGSQDLNAINQATIQLNDLNNVNQGLQQSGSVNLSLRPGKIGVEAVHESIAVLPPGIFGQPAGEAGYGAINPETFLGKIRTFLSNISMPTFILLVILGGLLMILAPFSKGYIDLGKKYIYWAVIGYVVLLIASAAIALLRGLFGSPR